MNPGDLVIVERDFMLFSVPDVHTSRRIVYAETAAVFLVVATTTTRSGTWAYVISPKEFGWIWDKVLHKVS